MLMTGIALKEECQEFMCHCIKAWLGEMGHAHIEAVGHKGDDANNIKCILDVLKGHCIPRSNEMVTATAHKQLVQGNLGLPEYKEKCKEVKKHETLAQHMINAYKTQYY